MLSLTTGDLLSLGWATTATRHVHLLVLQSRFFRRSELFFQPRFNIGRTESQQSAQLDASRQIAAVGMAVIDCLLGKTECGRKGFWSEKVFHRSHGYFKQSHDCNEYSCELLASLCNYFVVGACCNFAALAAVNRGKMRQLRVR